MDEQVKKAKELQVKRGQELLVAALQFYANDMDESELMGFVVRYGAAALERNQIQYNAHVERAIRANLN